MHSSRILQIALTAFSWFLALGAIPLALLGGLSLAGSAVPPLLELDLVPGVLLCAVLMLAIALGGRFPRKSLAVWGPLLLFGIAVSEYVMAATGCQLPAGIHPVNALGLFGVALGMARTSGRWAKKKEQPK